MTQTPNFMRYMRVDKILRSDKALTSRLGTPDFPVNKPDKSGTHHFSREVIALTRLIHAEGLDVQTLQKPALIRFAVEMLVTKSRPMPELEAPVSVEAAPAKQESKVEAKAAPASKKKAASKKVAQPAVRTPRTASVKADKTASTATPPKAAEDAASPESKLAASNGHPKDDEDDFLNTSRFSPVQSKGPLPFVVGIAAVSNLMAGCQLLEAYGNGEYTDICVRLNAVVDEIQAKAKIPTGAKSR